jgi:hypothetical protein
MIHAPQFGLRGQRGKPTEKQIEQGLNEYNAGILEFAWHRYPDTRSARAYLKAQPADYLVAVQGKAYHLEVKELRHPSRIAKDKISQLPVLLKFALAGLDFAVILHHTELDKWRCVPGSFFEGDIPPSWDVSQFPLLDNAEQALLATGWITQSE